MSVHKVQGGYVVRWREGGRNRQRTLKGAAKSDAREFERQAVRRQWQAQVGVSDSKMLFGEFLADWINKVEVADSTRRSYRYALKRVVARLGGYEMRQLSVPLIADFRAGLESAGVGAPMIRRTLSVVQAALRDATLEGYVDRNFASEVPKPSAPRKRAVNPVMPEVVERVRGSLPPQRLGDSTLIAVLAYAGMRPQEAVALRWSDVGKRTLSVHAPKTGRNRSVPLLAPLAFDLDAWRAGQPSSEYVFPRRDGKPWTETDWRNWRRRTFKVLFGEDAYPYELRHTFASLLIHEGRPIHEVASIMGHSASICLDTYAHVLADFDYAERESAEDRITRARAEVSAECSRIVRANEVGV